MIAIIRVKKLSSAPLDMEFPGSLSVLAWVYLIMTLNLNCPYAFFELHNK